MFRSLKFSNRRCRFNDNSCFYRAFSNVLNYEMLDISNNTLRSEKSISDIYDNEDWGYCGEKQEELSRNIRDKCYNWIINNKDTLHDESKITSDLVESAHGITFEEYEKIYKFHAGDMVVMQIKNKESQEIVSSSLLKERWGGFIEQYALFKIFKCKLNIYTALRFDDRTCKFH